MGERIPVVLDIAPAEIEPLARTLQEAGHDDLARQLRARNGTDPAHLSHNQVRYALQKAGVRTRMDTEERALVRQGNRDAQPKGGLTNEDLRRAGRHFRTLGYSATDTAMFLGVDRARVIRASGGGPEAFPRETPPRLWCDERLRFVPVSRETYAQRVFKEDRSRDTAEAEDRRERYVRRLRHLARRRRQAPGIYDFARHIGEAVSTICYWFGVRDGGSAHDAADRLYHEAGFERPDDRTASPSGA